MAVVELLRLAGLTAIVSGKSVVQDTFSLGLLNVVRGVWALDFKNAPVPFANLISCPWETADASEMVRRLFGDVVGTLVNSHPQLCPFEETYVTDLDTNNYYPTVTLAHLRNMLSQADMYTPVADILDLTRLSLAKLVADKLLTGPTGLRLWLYSEAMCALADRWPGKSFKLQYALCDPAWLWNSIPPVERVLAADIRDRLIAGDECHELMDEFYPVTKLRSLVYTVMASMDFRMQCDDQFNFVN